MEEVGGQGAGKVQARCGRGAGEVRARCGRGAGKALLELLELLVLLLEPLQRVLRLLALLPYLHAHTEPDQHGAGMAQHAQPIPANTGAQLWHRPSAYVSS